MNKPQAAQRSRRGGLAIHEKMRNDILWLRIEPGSAIDEVSLAEQYGVSRTPIREAVARLASEGLVHYLPNRTSIVAPLVLQKLKAFFDMYFLLSRAVAREAATKMRAEDAAIIAPMIEALRENIIEDVGEATQKQELSIRQRLSEISDNFFRDNAYRTILDAGIRTKFLYLYPNCHAEERKSLSQNWQEVWDAIVANDQERADAAIVSQIRFEERIVEKMFKADEGMTMPITHEGRDA